MRIFISNLNYNCKEEDLEQLFKSHGEIKNVSIITDKVSNKSKGFAFIEMPNAKEATLAIIYKNKYLFMGRELNVARAQ